MQEMHPYSPLSLQEAFHPTWMEIDLSQFRQNLFAIKKKIAPALFCLPVKANAYGHGILSIAQEAVSCGIDYLGVSCLQEGIFLRNHGITLPILVFGAFFEQQIDLLISHQLEFTIASMQKIDLTVAHCRSSSLKRRAKVHLKIDTGMSRIGVHHENAMPFIRYAHQFPEIEIRGVYSHPATAEHYQHPFMQKQIERFASIVELCRKEMADSLIFHLANSGAVCFYPNSYFQMVRPGSLSLGYLPIDRDLSPHSIPSVKPCLSLKSHVSYFKVVHPGTTISYNQSYVTRKMTRIVTIPIGYGDGYRRALSNQAQVLIRGRLYPVVGNICMDNLMVDIGEEMAYVGDEVTLVEKDGHKELSLENIARLAGTTLYELLVSFSSRIPRVYTD